MGEFIQHRWVVQAVKAIAEELRLDVRSYSGDWIIELRNDSVTRRIFGYHFDLNSDIASRCAEDKTAAAALLQEAGVACVPHLLLRSGEFKDTAWKETDWNEVVVKPLTGTSGHEVRKLASLDEVESFLASEHDNDWVVSPYIDIVSEQRVIILDDEPLLSYRKHPVMLDGLKMFNLGLGATPERTDLDDETAQLAKAATQTLGLRLAAVDVITLQTGEQKVLEVNNGIMMEHYATVSDEYKLDALGVYRHIITTMMQSSAILKA